MFVTTKMPGTKFGMLTVLSVASPVKDRNGSNMQRLNCLCDCGNTCIKYKTSLTGGKIPSCGAHGMLATQANKHSNWKGGRKLRADGYIEVLSPNHPKSQHKRKYILEQVLEMEKKLGRYLVKGECVHHLNGDRTDNRPENLELWSKVQPSGQRVEDKIKWAKELLNLYEPESLKTM